VDHFDPLDPEMIADPYPWYRWLLSEAPVYHDEANALWVLSRYEDVLAATRAPAALCSGEGIAYRRLPLPMMISMDPPGHTRLRAIVSRAFTPKSLERWQPIVDRLAREAVDRLLVGETADFVAAVASPFPVAVIGEILGVPSKDLPLLRRVSNDFIEGFKIGQEKSRVAGAFMDLMSNPRIIAGISSIGMRRPLAMRAFVAATALFVRALEGTGGRWFEDLQRAPKAVADLQAYFVDLVRERERHPTDDLLSKLIAAQPQASRSEPKASEDDKEGQLSTFEIFWFFALLLIAGHETTTNLLGNLVLALLDHPAEWEALRRGPSRVPAAVNEALRYDAPVQGFFRTARTSYAVGGREIPAGGRVLLLFAAGNRDPRKYEDPDVFRAARNPEDHLAFGGGIHFCLGASLARMEGAAVLGELVRRVRGFELAGPVERTHNPTLRGARRLPLRIAR
jgi:beta-dihydromenaquinone-9 omega-hydroxylase